MPERNRFFLCEVFPNCNLFQNQAAPFYKCIGQWVKPTDAKSSPMLPHLKLLFAQIILEKGGSHFQSAPFGPKTAQLKSLLIYSKLTRQQSVDANHARYDTLSCHVMQSTKSGKSATKLSFNSDLGKQRPNWTEQIFG